MRLKLLPESRILIDAKSSLHPIHGEATGPSGWAEVEVVDGHFDVAASQPRAHLELPVERLRSGNPLQDGEMLRRIDARRYPSIVAELKKAAPGNGPDRYKLTADFTFHGVTRRLELDAVGRLDGEARAVVETQFAIDVRSYDVMPPSFLGLKVHPDVKVRVQLVLEAEKG